MELRSVQSIAYSHYADQAVPASYVSVKDEAYLFYIRTQLKTKHICFI
jgi:hypothetical protein